MYRSGQLLDGRYQLERQLGRTAASRQTWIAEDLKSHPTELVILKLLAFGPQLNWQELELFDREAQILQKLDHPAIPRYRGSFDIDRTQGDGLCWFALVQDYLEGESLQDWLDRGYHFKAHQIRAIAVQLLEVLQYLHELSPPVLHRDLKPSNIIQGRDHRIYLVDFGSVQDQATITGVSFTVVGTSGYAPLEQFYGRAVPASDLYALGATLIHLATGVAPTDLLRSDGSLDFGDRFYSTPDGLSVDWLQRMVALDLKQRFRSAREALAVLSSPESVSPVRQHQLSHQSAPSAEQDRDRMARLELENTLLHLDMDWQDEQEQYKVRYGKHSTPRLPDLASTFTMVIGSVIMTALFIFIGGQWGIGILGWIGVIFLGQSVYYIWCYQSYRQALEVYEQRRALAIADSKSRRFD